MNFKEICKLMSLRTEGEAICRHGEIASTQDQERVSQ
jgi:hypothetical protein